MATSYLGMGECKASKTPNDILKIMALGSCVAVMMLDSKSQSVGLLHAALPDSSINGRRLVKKPGMFVDLGIPLLIKKMKDLGYDGKSGMIVKLAGGASVMDTNHTFNVGKRNITAVKNVLWKFGMRTFAEDVGGTFCRMVTVAVNNGKVTLSSPGREQWNL